MLKHNLRYVLFLNPPMLVDMAKALTVTVIIATSASPWIAVMVMAIGVEWLEPPFVIGAALSPLGLLAAIAGVVRGEKRAAAWVAAEVVALGWLILAWGAAVNGTGPLCRLL